MNTIGNIIVGIWFIPVTLFIFVPLALLGADLLSTGVKNLFGKARQRAGQHHVVGDRV